MGSQWYWNLLKKVWYSFSIIAPKKKEKSLITTGAKSAGSLIELIKKKKL
jgi:hypothetical protein